MSINRVFTFCAAFLLSSFALADGVRINGGGVSGGGGAVVCRDKAGAVRTVTVLDVYEAGIRQIPLDFGPATSREAILGFELDRFAKVDPFQAEVYRRQVKEFFDPAYSRFLKNITLPFSEDTGPIVPPVGCGYEQIVLQAEPDFPEDRLYTVNQDLWDKLDAKDQAALVLHEVIYHELIQGGAQTSFYARYFNEYLFSNRLASYAPFAYLKLLRKCAFNGANDRVISLNGVAYYLASVNTDRDGTQVTDAKLYGTHVFTIGGLSFSLRDRILYHEGKVYDAFLGQDLSLAVTDTCSHQVSAGAGLRFSEEGWLQLVDREKSVVKACVSTSKGWQPFTATSIEFDARGDWHPIAATTDEPMSLPVAGQELLTTSADFYPSDKVSRARMYGQSERYVSLLGEDERMHAYLVGSDAHFDELGKTQPPFPF